MPNKTIFTADIEPDLHTGRYIGVTVGLKRFENLCGKYGIKPILFVTSDCIEKHPLVFKKLSKKGWDISLHGLSHKRFDDMNPEEKEQEIKKSLKIFESKLGIKPRGFRAPQHSIDNETLDLLEKYGFEYDSSYAPLNLLQLIFFPRRIKNFLKIFFSRTSVYRIRTNLIEIPCSSFFIPFVSISLRVLPLWMMKLNLAVIKLIFEKPVFYAHSWDFIKMEHSRIDRMFSHEKFIKKLEVVMKNE